MNHEKELPMLAGIAGVLRWLETLAFIISGPVLTVALGVSLTDLLTHGSLLRDVPALVFVWAAGMAVGVDAQLVGAWDKCRQAIRRREWWAALGWVTLGLALGYVAFLSVETFSYQQSLGLSEEQALARLGISATVWQLQRAVLAVVLVALSGFNRYHPPSTADSAATEREKLQAELELEPLRAQLRARRALGWRDVGKVIIGGDATKPPVEVPAASQDDQQHASDTPLHNEPPMTPEPLQRDVSAPDEPPTRPPAGPGSPARRSHASKRRRGQANRPRILHMDAPEQRIRAALAETPRLSIRALAKRANVSQATASKYRRLVQSERASAEKAAQ